MNSITIRIGGMHCAGCAMGVEAALEDLPEVKSAAVDLASNSAKISFEGDALDMARIKKAVEDTGFTVEG